MAKNSDKEKAIVKNMEVLGISRVEAEDLYAFDQGDLEVAEVTEIEQKIETNSKDKKRSSIEKVKYMKAKKKKDGSKEEIIGAVFGFIKNNEHMILAQEIAANKMTFMDANGSYYTVTVTKHKGCPDGYNPLKERKKVDESIDE